MPHLAQGVVDLSKIKHLTLHQRVTADAPVFHKIAACAILPDQLDDALPTRTACEANESAMLCANKC
jgi:hypothetical protein